MTEEEAEKVLAAADQGFRVAGCASFNDAIDQTYKKYEELLGSLSLLRTRESAKRVLIEGTISAEQIQHLVAFLPRIVYELREGVLDAGKEIPHDPGGRPEVFREPGRKRQVCDEIAQWVRNGLSLTDGQKRAARQYGTSVRTIRRVWGERGENKSHP